MENLDGWIEVIVGLLGVFSLGATLTPTKKDDKVFTKMESVGSALNVVGIDLKVILGGIVSLFKKKK